MMRKRLMTEDTDSEVNPEGSETGQKQRSY